MEEGLEGMRAFHRRGIGSALIVVHGLTLRVSPQSTEFREMYRRNGAGGSKVAEAGVSDFSLRFKTPPIDATPSTFIPPPLSTPSSS